jgi:transcriptional regulator with XRE-family HTH domain
MVTYDQPSFGEALRQALQAAGMSQAELARKLNIDQGQVSRWVNDKTVPHRKAITRIENLLTPIYRPRLTKLSQGTSCSCQRLFPE